MKVYEVGKKYTLLAIYITVFLKIRNTIYKNRRSKVTDFAALKEPSSHVIAYVYIDQAFILVRKVTLWRPDIEIMLYRMGNPFVSD